MTRRWTEAENKLLQEMAQQGMETIDIFKSGSFPNRTYYSIERQLKRLRFGNRKKKIFGNQISKAEISSFDDVVARYVDAFNKLCERTEFTKEELERFRIIFMAAWKYREMFRSYEEIEEVKTDVERLKEMVAQLLAEEKNKEAQKGNP